MQTLGAKRKNKTTKNPDPTKRCNTNGENCSSNVCMWSFWGFSGAPNHDVCFVLCFVESVGRRWLYWFSGVQSDVGTSAASGLIFFRTEKYPGRHLPTDGDRRTHKEKALKKIEEKTQDFLNVGIGGADVPMCMQNSLDFLKWCATWFWHGLVIIYPRQNETTI